MWCTAKHRYDTFGWGCSDLRRMQATEVGCEPSSCRLRRNASAEPPGSLARSGSMPSTHLRSSSMQLQSARDSTGIGWPCAKRGRALPKAASRRLFSRTMLWYRHTACQTARHSEAKCASTLSRMRTVTTCSGSVGWAVSGNVGTRHAFLQRYSALPDGRASTPTMQNVSNHLR